MKSEEERRNSKGEHQVSTLPDPYQNLGTSKVSEAISYPGLQIAYLTCLKKKKKKKAQVEMKLFDCPR